MLEYEKISFINTVYHDHKQVWLYKVLENLKLQIHTNMTCHTALPNPNLSNICISK